MKIGLIQTAAVLAMASLCNAQSIRWSSPVLGYYFDAESKSIRSIAGVPGAAALEGGLPVGSKLELAVVSPSNNYALASSLESDRALVVSFSGAEVTGSRSLDQAASGFDSAYFSPDGHSAALVWKADGRIQVWTNLPDSPQLVRDSQIGEFAALAVSNDGDRVAVADANGVGFLGADAPVLAGAGYVSLSFSSINKDLAAANREAGQLTILSGDQAISFAAADARSVAFSADGARLIATAGAQVISFDIATRASSALPCDCTVSALERVRGNAVFRVSAAKDGYFSLYDGDSAEPRITLIAAGGNQ